MDVARQSLEAQELETESLLLLPVTLPLADAILAGDFSALGTRGLVRAPGWPRGDTFEIMSFLLIMKDAAGPCWLIVRKHDGAIIGDLGCKGQPDLHGEVEIGYGIVAAARRQGYGTEAVRALIQWLRSQPQVGMITAQCLLDNYSSIRILTRVGMQREKDDQNRLHWFLRATNGRCLAGEGKREPE